MVCHWGACHFAKRLQLHSSFYFEICLKAKRHPEEKQRDYSLKLFTRAYNLCRFNDVREQKKLITN